MMTIYIIFTFILSYILFSISQEDIKTMLISENKLIIFTIFGFLYLIVKGLSNNRTNNINLVINNISAMIIIFLFMYSISYISYKLLKINSLGIGDIKLLSISSIWLGYELSLTALSISFLLSAIYSLWGKLTGRFKPFHQYPFAPFISIGIFCCWFLDKI